MIDTGMLRASILTLLYLAGGGAAAADTITCKSLDGQVTADLDVPFTGDGDGGSAVAVRVGTPHFALSTEAKDHAERVAFSEVAYDRISVGLESPNSGSMTFTIDIVRTSHARPGDGPDTGVVVAGFTRIAGFGTAIVTCQGW
jgi:hypothetical protein